MNRRTFTQQASLAAVAAASTRWLRAAGAPLQLQNRRISASWTLEGGLRMAALRDGADGSALPVAGPVPVFRLRIGAEEIEASGMTIVHATTTGEATVVTLRDATRGVEVEWQPRLGSHYIRQIVRIKALDRDVPLNQVTLIDVNPPGIAVVGTVKGSPLVSGNWFLGFEHPLSTAVVEAGRGQSRLTRQLPLRAGQTVEYSSVIGVAAPGQMRRAVMQYVERERAHPYRPFLHYNSWYDLGYFTPYDEAAALDVIQAFGQEMHARRGVQMDSFLFDDGWDDHKFWGFNAGFPHGFAPLQTATAKMGAAPGVWMSPWGGYGKPRQERLDYAKQAGFETNRGGLALSGPVYYARFREVCLDMVRRFGVNQFKIDGTGSAATVVPGSAFGSDFEAAISLIGDLRAAKPDLFVNLTTGTYPSPFWLRYADSIWRGGSDHSFAGVGSDRQQWITYRDADTHKHVVQAGPLYPLNSLMLHGIIYARSAEKLMTDPQGDFDAEVRAYFGTGTQLQEMYITHSLLGSEDWDVLAEAANWSRRNASTLVDTHWIGGDPGALAVYGHAAWAGRNGIVTLRNPSDQAQSYDLEIAAALELPAGAPRKWTATTPWKRDQWRKPATPLRLALRNGEPHRFTLRPFEVLTLDVSA